MRRREFLGGVASFAWPLAARAQQSAAPVVGFLRTTPLADATEMIAALRVGLKDEGFVDGQNVRLELRSAENQPERLAALLAELIDRPVGVLVGNAVAMLAAKDTTATVPIVFAAGGDPVRDGLVASMNRPGGNVTGVNFFAGLLGAKRLELLRRLAPNAKPMAMLVNPNAPNNEAERRDVQDAARTVGQQLLVRDVGSAGDIEDAFEAFAKAGAGTLLVGSGPVLVSHRRQIIELAARHALPASYPLREYAAAGGLMSYGASVTDAYRQAGVYAGRILKGEKPGELPVMRSTKFELVVNLKTAGALGLEIPPQLLAVADEVME
jgi:putative tryptophan/tyrosine transport system substrate-binding protein